METRSDDRDWHYSRCYHCDAEWYAPFRPLRCSRCGHFVKTSELRLPPWLQEKSNQDDEDSRP